MTRTRPKRRIRRLLAEFPETVLAVGTAVIVEWGLRRGTLPPLARRLGAPLHTSAGVEPDLMAGPKLLVLPTWARRRVSATRRVLRHWPFGDTCLRQALISGHLLRKLEPELHVGVARIDGEIRAHAWLGIHGGVLDPRASANSYMGMVDPKQGGQVE